MFDKKIKANMSSRTNIKITGITLSIERCEIRIKIIIIQEILYDSNAGIFYVSNDE